MMQGQGQAGLDLLHHAIDICPPFAPESVAARADFARASR